jgi:hypothetical protein
MSARGVDFLEVWIDEHVPYTGRQGDPMFAKMLAKRLTAAAAIAGLTLEDLTLGTYSPEKYIMEALAVPIELTTNVWYPPSFGMKSHIKG